MQCSIAFSWQERHKPSCRVLCLHTHIHTPLWVLHLLDLVADYPLSTRETFFIHPPLWSCCHLACLLLKLTFSWKLHYLLKHNLNINGDLMTWGELDQTSLVTIRNRTAPWTFRHHFDVGAKRILFNIHHRWLNSVIRCCYLDTVLVFLLIIPWSLSLCCVSRSWLRACVRSNCTVQTHHCLPSFCGKSLTDLLECGPIKGVWHRRALTCEAFLLCESD